MAVFRAVATQQRVEPRGATTHERRVRGVTRVVRIFTDTAVVCCQLAPVVVRREPPSISQRLTRPVRRVPRVETAILTAVVLRVVVAEGRLRVDVQILRRPLFAVGHPPGGISPARFAGGTKARECDAQRHGRHTAPSATQHRRTYGTLGTTGTHGTSDRDRLHADDRNGTLT